MQSKNHPIPYILKSPSWGKRRSSNQTRLKKKGPITPEHYSCSANHSYPKDTQHQSYLITPGGGMYSRTRSRPAWNGVPRQVTHPVDSYLSWSGRGGKKSSRSSFCETGISPWSVCKTANCDPARANPPRRDPCLWLVHWLASSSFRPMTLKLAKQLCPCSESQTPWSARSGPGEAGRRIVRDCRQMTTS